MGAAVHIGRVGGLAVALGVGAAVAFGQGVAAADSTDSETASSTAESGAGAAAANTGAPSGSGSSAPGSEDPGPEAGPASGPRSGVARTAPRIRVGSPLVRLAERGTALGSGGALTSRKVARAGAAEKGGAPRKDVEADPAGVDKSTVDPGAVDATNGGTDPVRQVGAGSPNDPETIAPQESNRPNRPSHRSAARAADADAGRVPPPVATVTVRTIERVSDTLASATAPARSGLRQVSGPPEAVSAVMTAAATPTSAEATLRAIGTVAPTAVAAPQIAAAQPATRQLVTDVLSALGVGSFSGGLPGAPAGTPVALALLAWASRRETEQQYAGLARSAAVTTTPTTTTAVAQAATAQAAAAPTGAVTTPVYPGTTRTPVAVSGNTDFIEFVTGPGNLNNTGQRFGIGGTDLGIMWDNGIRDDPTTAVNEHQVLIAFGDTFSNTTPVRTGVWRMNTLFRSADNRLSDGLYIPDGVPHDVGMYSGSPMTNPNFSREIIGKYPYAVGQEVTIIPTAAISVPGAGANGATRQYINFMSVRSWDSPGRWTTNYSGIAYSDDNGQNWTVVPASSVRPAAAGRSNRPFVNGNQNFQQGAYVKGVVKDANGNPVRDANGQFVTDGHVYAYGTPSGRGGTVYLSRVPEQQILDQTKYQYWNGSAWVNNNPAAAKPILPGTTTSSFFGLIKNTTYPSVGEMSVQYNSYEKKYIMLYADANNNVVMRKADKPEGPWSAPTTLVTSAKVPGLYAPMIHPWSSTDNLSASEQQYLYWNMSTWDDYQVRLMRTDLSKV
ncbi:MAG: DUF4185 domain-containing protein [Actinobacteria bacterium]|nr:DUF4185 domain-containing protein [Actinomycetota bacterium]